MINLSSLFGGGSKSLIGVDISSSAVKMVELSGAGSDYQLERYAIEPLPREAVADGNIADLEAVAEGVKMAWKRLSSSTKLVALALPPVAVITKKVILPAGLNDLDMEVQVESEANQYIPFAIEEVNLDFQVLGPAPGGDDEVEVLIAASRKEKVQDRVAAAESAGLKISCIDAEAFAEQAAFELIRRRMPGGGKNKIIAMVDVGANTMRVTVLRNSIVLYSRDQPFGGYQLTQDISRTYSMSIDEAENAKRTGALPENYERELLRPFMDSLGLEISRALQFFFTSTQFNQVDLVVLCGGCAAITGLERVVTSRTQVDTVISNPFAGMKLSSRIRPKNLASEAPALMVACGLALRRFNP